jgi:acetyl-CoA carboxylase carboxyl transferase subunit alpha
MKIMSTDLKDLGIVDEIIPEPDGGAHGDHEAAAKLFGDVLERQLLMLTSQSRRELLDARYQKFRHMCQFFDLGA